MKSRSEVRRIAMQNPAKAVEKLVCSIIRAKKEYYAGKPTISDSEYDFLENSLKNLDPEHPVLALVGYDSSYDWWLRFYGKDTK